MVNVYGWMATALMVTGFVGLLVVSNETILNLIFENSTVFYGLIILEVLMVGALAGWVRSSFQRAGICWSHR